MFFELLRSVLILLVILFGCGLIFAAATQSIPRYLRWCRRLSVQTFNYVFRRHLKFTLGFIVGILVMYFFQQPLL